MNSAVLYLKKEGISTMSILSGGGGASGFDLDLKKLPSPLSGRSSSSSSPSSTISESSSSPLAISTKRARTPRKRPNQSYTEAAALLSTIYPNLFSTKNLHKLSKQSKPFSSLSSSCSDLVPHIPIVREAGFLIEDSCSPHGKPCFRFEVKPASPSDKSCIEYQEPSSPESPDFDVESILDEEVGEGIDSIMGNLSMENCDSNYTSYVNPHLGSLMGFGLGGKVELGFGYGIARNNIYQALRGDHSGEWWRPTTAVVPVGEINVPKFNSLPPLEKKKKKSKKKKKKVEEEEEEEVKGEPKHTVTAKKTVPTKTMTTTEATTSNVTSTDTLDAGLKCGLGLKLNHDDVLSVWSDRDFPFTNESGGPESSADIHARLAEIKLFLDNEGGGVREASVQRYKEKRRTRLFSKKIRYQVRKVNADRRPRMKASGRFVKRPDLLQEAIEEESQ